MVILAAVAALAGCRPQPTADVKQAPGKTAPPPTASRGTIGFSALTLKNPFFKIIADSLTDEARRQGFEVIVSDAERDVQEQTKHVENFLAQRVTAIVLNPADRIAIGPAIKKANEAGVPVFTCDLECEVQEIEVAGHIGTDNYGGGKLAGEAMIEVLRDAGGEVLIVHFKQANSCVERVRGFREVIDKHNAGRTTGKINIVAELEGGGLQDQGFRATADALQAHPNLDAIFAINDPSALGAWTALQQVGKTEHVKIIGFDGQLEGKLAIKEGKFYADPIQFPEKMGVSTVQNIVKYLDGEPFEKKTYIPTELYRKADADRDPALQPAKQEQ
jgi:ribose transport system substrate-binding protein